MFPLCVCSAIVGLFTCKILIFLWGQHTRVLSFNPQPEMTTPLFLNNSHKHASQNTSIGHRGQEKGIAALPGILVGVRLLVLNLLSSEQLCLPMSAINCSVVKCTDQKRTNAQDLELDHNEHQLSVCQCCQSD